MGRINKTFAMFLALIIVMPCLTIMLVRPASTQPTPFQIFPPSTTAPSKNYTIPPLSSLNLNVSLNYGLGPQGGCNGLIYIKGGGDNDINFRVINPQGKTILDLGRITNQNEFHISPDETGNFTIILDNQFSIFSSKEVNVFSATYPDNTFEFAGFSINFWAIILVTIISVASLMTFFVLLSRRKK